MLEDGTVRYDWSFRKKLPHQFQARPNDWLDTSSFIYWKQANYLFFKKKSTIFHIS